MTDSFIRQAKSLPVSSEVQTVPGTSPVPSEYFVKADNVTIQGVGTGWDPLRAVPGGVSVVDDGITIIGDGTTDSPLVATALNYQPARTLLVAKSWPAGVPATVCFTTLSSALVQGAAMNPSLANGVLIKAYPGTYTEDLTLVSNVAIASDSNGFGSVQLNGNITWTPGAGVNASQSLTNETITLNSIVQASSKTFTFNSTAKDPDNPAVLVANILFGTVSFTGRGTAGLSGNGGDNAFLRAPVNFQVNTLSNTFNNMVGSANSIGVEILGARLRSITFAGNTVARIESGDGINMSHTIALTGTANVTANGVDRIPHVTCAAGCTFTACGSTIVSTMSGAGTFDVRGANYGGNANLLGITGTCKRTTWTDTAPITAMGNNTVTFAVPYPDGNYNVTFSQRSGTPTVPTYGTKTGTSFVLADGTGGNVFDYTVTYD